MKKLLDALITSGRHLDILHTAYQQNYSLYAQIASKLEEVYSYDELRKEIYAGGKKRGKYGYSRQMILGDLLQYILTGRGYYFVTREGGYIESFVRILMYVSNLLILMDDASTDVNLRNKVLDELERKLHSSFFEDDEQETKFRSLRNYGGKVIPGEGREHEDIYDSVLPKRVGGVPEILVYTYLIRKNYGYVIPLLQAQRLLGGQDYIIPPDFLLLRSKGEIFGLEVGTGKERQIASFSTITSIPVFTVGIGSLEQPQPYRCGKCQKWIIYCDQAINVCARNEDKRGQEYLDCTHCPINDLYQCPYVVYYGQAQDHDGRVKKLRYHYSCVKDDPEVQRALFHGRKRLIAPLPWIGGLEKIREDAY